MRRIVLDQGLPATAAMILRDGGWDAVHVREIAMSEAADGEILDYAAHESCVAITLDRDFPQILALTAATRPSVVLIRRQRLRSRTARKRRIGASRMALLAGRKVLFVMAGVVAPFHAHFRQVNRPLCRHRIERMGRVAVTAFGNVFLLFRIVWHVSMGIGLFPAGRYVLGGSFDDLGEGTVAVEALVL